MFHHFEILSEEREYKLFRAMGKELTVYIFRFLFLYLNTLYPIRNMNLGPAIR
jgi:hypothetical protein